MTNFRSASDIYEHMYEPILHTVGIVYYVYVRILALSAAYYIMFELFQNSI